MGSVTKTVKWLPHKKLLKMAVKWVSASGDPARRSCMRYFCSAKHAATDNNVDSNLALYPVRPSP